MKQYRIIIPILIILAFVSCKSPKKIATYEDLYKERPITILVAPVQDNAKRLVVKTKQDEVLNDELVQAAHFMRQSTTEPLVNMGYYPLAPLASDVILEKYGKNYRQLSLDGLTELHNKYGIDAVLLVAIHKWEEPEVNEVVVYAEYTLRSTHTGLELMHTWVRGSKMQPVDVKGDPIELTTDNEFINKNGVNNRLAHRLLLLQGMSDFVLRGLPTSSNRWMFEHDRNMPANPTYYNYVIMPDGSIERNNYSEDAFGNECFTD